MDLFTHVLVAYLLSFGIVGFQPNYLIAGAIAGGLPDGDIFLWPLSRRFKVLRHHGISHSIFGVTVLAAVGGLLVAPRLAPGNPLVYFAVMLAAGLGHMLMDGFTHFSVPPFLPFSERKLELDADVSINFVTLVVSIVSFYLLLGVERGHVAFWIYLATVYILIVFFAAYFILRLAGRFWAARQLRRMGLPGVPVPTTNPFTWLLLHEAKAGGRLTMWFARYSIGRGITKGPFTMDIPTPPLPGTGPVVSQVEALSRSYPIALEEGRFFSVFAGVLRVRPSGVGPGDVRPGRETGREPPVARAPVASGSGVNGTRNGPQGRWR
ncbi:MAG: metal-dependent hydrolase [Thermoplasmata archaeon]|nr:metal-dependent hydrolase [Thermoplasmata archaeon]